MRATLVVVRWGGMFAMVGVVAVVSATSAGAGGVREVSLRGTTVDAAGAPMSVEVGLAEEPPSAAGDLALSLFGTFGIGTFLQVAECAFGADTKVCPDLVTVTGRSGPDGSFLVAAAVPDTERRTGDRATFAFTARHDGAITVVPALPSASVDLGSVPLWTVTPTVAQDPEGRVVIDAGTPPAGTVQVATSLRTDATSTTVADRDGALGTARVRVFADRPVQVGVAADVALRERHARAETPTTEVVFDAIPLSRGAACGPGCTLTDGVLAGEGAVLSFADTAQLCTVDPSDLFPFPTVSIDPSDPGSIEEFFDAFDTPRPEIETIADCPPATSEVVVALGEPTAIGQVVVHPGDRLLSGGDVDLAISSDGATWQPAPFDRTSGVTGAWSFELAGAPTASHVRLTPVDPFGRRAPAEIAGFASEVALTEVEVWPPLPSTAVPVVAIPDLAQPGLTDPESPAAQGTTRDLPTWLVALAGFAIAAAGAAALAVRRSRSGSAARDDLAG